MWIHEGKRVWSPTDTQVEERGMNLTHITTYMPKFETVLCDEVTGSIATFSMKWKDAGSAL
jgi:hypothetical protein